MIVVSSLFFHHLTKAQKIETLKEIFRVLKLGGRLHIADWGKPSSFVQQVLFIVVQLLDRFETTQDSVESALPKLIKDSGVTHIANRHFFSDAIRHYPVISGNQTMIVQLVLMNNREYITLTSQIKARG